VRTAKHRREEKRREEKRREEKRREEKRREEKKREEEVEVGSKRLHFARGAEKDFGFECF
jgi:hypothetical protein